MSSEDMFVRRERAFDYPYNPSAADGQPPPQKDQPPFPCPSANKEKALTRRSFRRSSLMSSEDMFVRRERAFDYVINFPQRMDSRNPKRISHPSFRPSANKEKALARRSFRRSSFMSSEDMFVRRERAFDLAEKEGFEPSRRFPDKRISSAPRYDLFDTSPHFCN